MDDRETPRMHKYEENKTTRILTATVRHVSAGSGFRKFHTAWFLLDCVYVHSFTKSSAAKQTYDMFLFVICICSQQVMTRFTSHIWRSRNRRWVSLMRITSLFLTAYF